MTAVVRAAAAVGLLRRLRVAWVTLLALVLTTLLVVAAVTVVPRLVDDRFARSVEQVLRAAPDDDRVVRIDRRTRIPTRVDGALDRVRAAGAAVVEDLDPVLAGVLGPAEITVDSGRFTVLPEAGDPEAGNVRHVTFRHQAGLDAAAALVEGRLPRPSTTTVQIPPAFGDVELGVDELALVEVAMTATTADKLSLDVGQRLLLVADQDDPLARTGFLQPVPPVVVELTGLLALPDVTEPPFRRDLALHRASAVSTGIFTTIFAYGWVPEGTLARMGDGTLGSGSRLRWVHAVDPGGVATVGAEDVRAAVRRTEATFPRQPTEGGASVRTGLGDLLDAALDRRDLSLALLAVATAGLLGTVLAVVGLLARLRARRREPSIRLQRGRGASTWQLVGAELVESGGGVALAGALGLATAVVLVPGAVRGYDVALAVVVSLGVLSTVLVPALDGVRVGAGGAVDAGARRRPRAGAARARLVVELAVVVAAVAAVVAARGHAGEDALDPLVLSVPLLVGLAAAVVTLRLTPLVLEHLAGAAAAHRGLVLPLALRRAARGGQVSPLVVALLPVAAVGVFVATVVVALDDGRELAAWRSTGADVAVHAGDLAGLPVDDAVLDDVPGAAASAPLAIRPLDVRTPGLAQASLPVVLVDPARLDRVTAGGPVATRIARALGVADATAPDDEAATGLRAVASSTWLRDLSLAPGDELTVAVEGSWVDVTVVALRSRAPVPLDGPWLLMDRADVEAVARRPFPTSTVLLRATDATTPSTLAEATRERLEAAAGRPEALAGATVAARDRVAADLAAEPLGAATRDGFLGAVAAVLAGGLAVVLVVVVLGAERRRRELALLRILGAGGRDLRRLAVLEVVPSVLLALGVGAATGAAVAGLLAPSLDLAPFAGGVAAQPDAPPWPALLAGGALLLATTAGLSALAAGRGGRSVGTTLAQEVTA